MTYYTDEELQKATENNNALQYALSRGYDLVREGNEYHLKEHDSMVFEMNGKWHWNSQHLHGHALDFIQQYEGKDIQEAVCILAGTVNISAPVGPVHNTVIPPPEKKEFVLPKRADNFRIIFAYLIKERGIDEGLVKNLVFKNKIYQSAAYSNLVMVGYDNQNVARYASQRSTNSYTKIFKRDVNGSDKSYPFVIDGSIGNPSDTVCVFESPIEAMSYWTLCKETGSDRINCHMISLGGAGVLLALDRFLSDNPQIKNIVVGLNNDSKEFGHTINAGENGTKRIFEKYGDKYHVTLHQPHLNDWNDVLKSYRHNHLEEKMKQLQQHEVKARASTKSRSVAMEI